VNSFPKTVTRQRSDCDLNPGPSAPESSTLITRLPSHPTGWGKGGNVTSAAWPVIGMCDPLICVWHVSSRSGEVGLLTK